MKHSYFKIPGWFNYSETYDIIVDQIPDDGKIVEIGSFLGRSTHYLATALINANKENVKIYSVDTFEGSSEHSGIDLPKDFCHIFKENLQYFIGRNMVHVCQGRSDSEQILNYFDDGSIDYIMVDGAHEYEAVVDDYLLNSVAEGVKQGLKELKISNFGANRGVEQTWYCSKNNKSEVFEKLIPGVNTLKR